MLRRSSKAPEEKRSLDTYIKLMRAADTVTANAQRHLAQAGLTTSQFGVIEALFHLGPLCQRDIGKKILKSSGNITTVIDNLEKRGLVKRRPGAEDRRYVAVHLTAAGEELIRELFPSHAAGIVAELGVLTPQEQEELGRLCRKLGRKQG